MRKCPSPASVTARNFGSTLRMRASFTGSPRSELMATMGTERSLSGAVKSYSSSARIDGHGDARRRQRHVVGDLLRELRVGALDEQVIGDERARLPDEVGFERLDERRPPAPCSGAGAPIDLKVSTPMMPMTRPLSSARGFDGHRAAHGVADQDDLLVRHRRQRGGHVLAEAGDAPVGAIAVGAAVAGEIHRDQRVFLLEHRHLLAPVVRIAGPAVDEHQRRLAAAVHAVLHVHAVGRDRDARRAFGGLGFARWPRAAARRRRRFLLAAGNDGQSSNESGERVAIRVLSHARHFRRTTRRSHRWRAPR